jgi:hypothetical protein
VARVAAGLDEVVIREPERPGQLRERGRVAPHQRAHRHALGLRGQHVLERIVVGPGLEPHQVAALPVVPG